MLRGYHLPFTTPRLDKGGRNRTVGRCSCSASPTPSPRSAARCRSSSASCSTSFTRSGTVSGVLLVLTYGAGMALVLTALTVTLALARGGLLAGLRRVLPYVDRVAGVFLILAGLYLVYYWIFNLRFDATGSTTGGGLVSTVEGWSSTRRPGSRTAAVGCCGTLLVGARRRDRRRLAWPAAATTARVSSRPSDPSAFAELLAHPASRRWSSSVAASGSWPTTAARSRR